MYNAIKNVPNIQKIFKIIVPRNPTTSLTKRPTVFNNGNNKIKLYIIKLKIYIVINDKDCNKYTRSK